jgi:cytidine deaminase
MNVKNKNILKKSKIIIVKICDGNITNCNPCKMCKKLLSKYKINNINTLFNEKITKIS